MGYYNLPAQKSPTELNQLERLLRNLNVADAKEALDLLETLTRNTAQNPSEEKYRRLRTSNAKLGILFNSTAMVQVMQEMGWQEEGEFMVLPKSITLDFPQHVVKILEAKSYYAKEKEDAKRAAKLGEDPSKQGMLRQLDLDRQERAAGQAPEPAQSEEDQIAEAIKLSMQADVPSAPAPAKAPAGYPQEKKAPIKSEFDFKRREDPEKKRQEGEMSLQDIRALQKQKFKDFQADPNAQNSEIYKRPAAVAPGAKKEQSWGEWMFGSSSSSSDGGGGGGGGGGERKGPRVKTIADLPKPRKPSGG